MKTSSSDEQARCQSWEDNVDALDVSQTANAAIRPNSEQVQVNQLDSAGQGPVDQEMPPAENGEIDPDELENEDHDTPEDASPDDIDNVNMEAEGENPDVDPFKKPKSQKKKGRKKDRRFLTMQSKRSSYQSSLQKFTWIENAPENIDKL